jgi:hypothetical protein
MKDNFIKLSAIILFNMFHFNVSAQDESYLCIAEQITGFSRENNKWVQTNFKSDVKYIIKSSSNNDAIKYHVEVFGVKQECDNGSCYTPLESLCYDDFNKVGYLGCVRGDKINFEMSKNTGKYIRMIGSVGFVFDKKSTPYIEIGSCSLL